MAKHLIGYRQLVELAAHAENTHNFKIGGSCRPGIDCHVWCNSCRITADLPAILLVSAQKHLANVREAASGQARPEIVVLCGSTRFYNTFQQANYDLTMAGRIVLSVGFYPHAKAEHGHGEGVGHDSAEKVELDELHKRKIDLADRVYVLNVGGYIGSSTRSEIEYAEKLGKPITYLSQKEAVTADVR